MKTGDLTNGEVASTSELVSDIALTECGLTVHPPDTVLVSMYGGFAQIGRTGLLKVPAATNQAIMAIRCNSDLVHPKYLQVVLNSRVSYWKRIAGSSRKDPNITGADVGAFPLDLPTLQEQVSVVAVERSLSRVSEVLLHLATTKRQFKLGLAHRLFEDVDSCLSAEHLGRHAAEVTSRNTLGLSRDRVMGVIKDVGLVPMRERIRVGDLARYKDVPPDAFAYNPMRINIGSIARNTSDKACLVSPDYVVFQTDPDSLLPEYLDQLRHTRLWQNHMDRAGAGGVRIRIYFRDLAEIRVPLPSLEEQRKIANLLSSLDHEIATLERLADAYAKLRSALLDKLLSGEIPIPAS